jgi:dipeptidyl aminopeptidase/acylaminoacyl peptidase
MLVGCNPKSYQDISDSISSQPLPVPEGEFTSVAWLDKDHIAFIYRSEELIPRDLGTDFRIIIFEISSGKTKTLPHSSIPSSCFPPSRISELTRLRNGSLGFVFRCHSENGTSGILYVWDNGANSFVEWQSLPDFLPRNFSFAPDMSQFIQENGVGDGLNNELYLINSDKKIIRLLRDFQRAGEPAWSSDGKTIAFAGTKENPENTNINTWQDIESLFYYPWDIYLMDSDGSNVRILLPLAGNVYDLKWSPTNSNFLLFGGTAFDDSDGIWLLDIATMSVRRIWAENTRFDWSPDGSKIVLLENDTGIQWNSVTVIELNKP